MSIPGSNHQLEGEAFLGVINSGEQHLHVILPKPDFL